MRRPVEIKRVVNYLSSELPQYKVKRSGRSVCIDGYSGPGTGLFGPAFFRPTYHIAKIDVPDYQGNSIFLRWINRNEPKDEVNRVLKSLADKLESPLRCST